MLAEDKLKEARFFLRQMKLCRKYSDFRYYLSAFMSAARSITLVLQKDLRSRHGESFDQWYKEQQLKIASNQTALIVKLCRNVMQKEGSRLPIYTLRFSDPNYTGESLEFRYDLGALEEERIQMNYRFPKGVFENIILDDKRLEEEQIREKIHEKIPYFMDRIEDLTNRLFHSIKPERFVSFRTSDSPKPLTIWIKELDGYLNLLQEIILEAKNRFIDKKG